MSPEAQAAQAKSFSSFAEQTDQEKIAALQLMMSIADDNLDGSLERPNGPLLPSTRSSSNRVFKSGSLDGDEISLRRLANVSS